MLYYGRFYQYNISFFILTGFYAPCSHNQVSNHLTLLAESLPPESSKQSFTPTVCHGNRNRCPVPGILYNTNTLEGFQALDKQSVIRAEAKKVSSYSVKFVLLFYQFFIFVD